jgi:hypothetical protein
LACKPAPLKLGVSRVREPAIFNQQMLEHLCFAQTLSGAHLLVLLTHRAGARFPTLAAHDE